MTHISLKNRTAHLSLADSMILASAHTSDGRELDACQRRVRGEVREVANKIGESIEIYACQRHGGHIVDVVEPDGYDD